MKNQRSFLERIRPLFEHRSRGQLLYLAAMLESAAASRYREWAAKAAREEIAKGLRGCAEREDEIAAIIRRDFAGELEKPEDSAELMEGLRREVAEMSRGTTIEEQFPVQASAERAGEQLWKALAGSEPAAEKKAVFLQCAELEAASALYLENL